MQHDSHDTSIVNMSIIENRGQLNTARAIALSGRREAFQNFIMELLYECNARLGLPIFIETFASLHAGNLRLRIELDEEFISPMGTVKELNEGSWVWQISERGLADVIVYSIAPLCFATQQLCLTHTHIDEGMDADSISIYCEVID